MGRRFCSSSPFHRGERIALYLDLENLLYGDGVDRVEAFAALIGALRAIAARGVLVAAIACCECALARDLGFALGPAGVRVFTHRGGPDAADHALLERIRLDLPPSARTVVIGSGDHIFAGIASELRARGVRVEVLARCGALSHELYAAADRAHMLDVPRRRAV